MKSCRWCSAPLTLDEARNALTICSSCFYANARPSTGGFWTLDYGDRPNDTQPNGAPQPAGVLVRSTPRLVQEVMEL